MTRKAQIALGIILIPIFFALFMLDRILLVFLPWLQSYPVKAYFDTTNHMITALYRVATASAMLVMFMVFKWLLS